MTVCFQKKKQSKQEANYSPLQHMSPYRQPLTAVTNTATGGDAISHVGVCAKACTTSDDYLRASLCQSCFLAQCFKINYDLPVPYAS